jgi:thiamine-phosphate pyrophosphorylase
VIVAITDPRYSLEHTLDVIARVRAVVPDVVVQHRDKVSPAAARESAARAIVATGVRTIINGTADEARRLGAYGVHLSGDRPDIGAARAILGEGAWVSIPAHDDAAIERALVGRATAVLVSPIFATPGKGAPRGLEAISRARAIAGDRVRIIALGGIDSRRAASCRAAGADGIAVIRAIFDAPDPAHAALELVRPLRP